MCHKRKLKPSIKCDMVLYIKSRQFFSFLDILVSNDNVCHNWKARTSSYQAWIKDIIQEEPFLATWQLTIDLATTGKHLKLPDLDE